jgi:D-threo-aldose 1-dehydrogenase
LGVALRDRPRNDFVLSTKVGRVLEPNPLGRGSRDDQGFDVEATSVRRWDFSADGVRRSLDDSLQRLGMDRVDVVYLHDPEEFLDQAIAEALPALHRLRDQGVIGAVGVGSKDTNALTALIQTGGIDVAMVAGRYTLLEQPALDQVLPAAAEHQTGVVAVGVFNSGLLARARPDKNAKYDYAAVPPEVYERAVALAAFCTDRGVALPHAAVQFPLRHPIVINITLGAGNPAHLESSVNFAEQPLPEEFWAELAAAGLLAGSEDS